MGNRNIVLIGLPGCGKTTLGRRIARIFNLAFLDTDAEIERLTGKTIPEIFALEGEAGFRAREAKVTAEASLGSRTVIAAGGGVVLLEENIHALKANGLVVFIDRPPERIARDVSTNHRPLLSGGSARVFDISRDRRPLYEKYSDVAIPNGSGTDQAVVRLSMLVRSEYPPLSGYAVIGDPIAHTLSPPIHDFVFAHMGCDSPYVAIHVPKGTTGDFARRARESGLRGFNVTIPHKQDILPHLDDISPEASLCGAVNTVIIGDGKLTGYNTDMDGFAEALRGKGYGYAGKHIAILGAGGAARGIALKAAAEGSAWIHVHSRNPEQAEALCEHIRRANREIECEPGAMTPEALADSCMGADILINATPLGMAGVADSFPSLDFLICLPSTALVCDLVYTPPMTPLLKAAKQLDLRVMNGFDMLLLQALLADELFLGRKLSKRDLLPCLRGRFAPAYDLP